MCHDVRHLHNVSLCELITLYMHVQVHVHAYIHVHVCVRGAECTRVHVVFRDLNFAHDSQNTIFLHMSLTQRRSLLPSKCTLTCTCIYMHVHILYIHALYIDTYTSTCIHSNHQSLCVIDIVGM